MYKTQDKYLLWWNAMTTFLIFDDLDFEAAL